MQAASMMPRPHEPAAPENRSMAKAHPKAIMAAPPDPVEEAEQLDATAAIEQPLAKRSKQPTAAESHEEVQIEFVEPRSKRDGAEFQPKPGSIMANLPKLVLPKRGANQVRAVPPAGASPAKSLEVPSKQLGSDLLDHDSGDDID